MRDLERIEKYRELALEIADEDSAATIESSCLSEPKSDGGEWWNLKSADVLSRPFLRRAVRFLALRGKIKRHPDKRHLVSVELERTEVLA